MGWHSEILGQLGYQGQFSAAFEVVIFGSSAFERRILGHSGDCYGRVGFIRCVDCEWCTRQVVHKQRNWFAHVHCIPFVNIDH